MSINGYGLSNPVTDLYRRDPIGLGIPFSPIYYGPTQPDKFEHKTVGESGKEKEGFTAEKAAGSFIKGVTEPFIEMLKHPIKSLGIAAGIGLAIKKVPVLGKYAAIAGLVVGGFQLLTGFGNAVSGLASGKSEEAEAGFKSMGTGTVSTVLSAFGFKGAKGAEAPQAGGIFAKVGGFFKNIIGGNKNASVATGSANNTIGIETLLSNEARNVPGYIAKGVVPQVPFVNYLNVNNEEKGGAEGKSEPLVLQMADNLPKNLLS